MWKASNRTGALGEDSSGRLNKTLASVALETDGFSSKACLPARIERTAHSKCKLFGSGIKTASIFGSSRISIVYRVVIIHIFVMLRWSESRV